MNRDREADLSKRLEKAQEDVQRLDALAFERAQIIAEQAQEIAALKTELNSWANFGKDKDQKLTRLTAWKESAMPIMAPLQEIGKAIGVGLGMSIPEEILPYITEQKRVIAELKEDNQLLRRKIENHIIMSEDFKAEYNDWLDSLEAI